MDSDRKDNVADVAGQKEAKRTAEVVEFLKHRTSSCRSAMDPEGVC
jgi:hypothetical protein